MIKNLMIAILLSLLSAGGYWFDHSISRLQTAITALEISQQAMQLKHKQQILKTKVKERGKRLVAAIPVAGAVAITWFEAREFEEWKIENPQGDLQQYSEEMFHLVKQEARIYIDDIQSEGADLWYLIKNNMVKTP